MERTAERRIPTRRSFLKTTLLLTASAMLAGCDMSPVPSPSKPDIQSGPKPDPSAAPFEKPEFRPVPLPSPVIPVPPIERSIPPAVISPKPAEPAPKPKVASSPAVQAAILLPPRNAPNFEEYIEGEPLITDPNLRAASIGILTFSSEDQTRAFIGHGGLFLDEHKRPFIMTTKHILPANSREKAHILMPGIGLFRNKSLQWKVVPSTRMGKDPNVAYYFDSQEGWLHRVMAAIAERKIVPLTTTVPDLKKPFSAVISMAEKGLGGKMGYMGYLDYQNRLIFQMSEGYVCKGYSGQPALVVENGAVTSKSCGLVVAGSVSPEIPCNNKQVWVRPHF